jgi:CheY-like chemotaxis protein
MISLQLNKGPLLRSENELLVRKRISSEPLAEFKQGGASPVKILLADDNPIVRTLLARILRTAGHDILEASDGLEATQIQAATPADILITDMLMPRKNGVETILHFKVHHPKVMVIATSGGGRIDGRPTLDAALGAGADAVFPKGGRIELLFQLIRKAQRSQAEL